MTVDGASVLLRVRGLRKAFGGLVAVRDLSFDMPAGAITGLIGPNGSGKTTVLNLITGELAADRGPVLLEAASISGSPPFRICRARIARTFQLVRVLAGMTARENVMLGRMFGSEPTSPARAARDAEALLERVGLAGRDGPASARSSPTSTRSASSSRARSPPARDCSCSTSGSPASIPPSCRSASTLIRQIRRDGITIVMVEHVMEAIRALCDRVVVMNAGERIAEGTPDAVLSDRQVMRAYLGADDAAA